MVIDVLVDAFDESEANILLKSLFIGAVADVLMNILAVTMVDAGMTILLVGTMIASGFLVSASYSVVALASDWAKSVMESIIEAVVETLAAVPIVCVVSGTVVDVLAGVDGKNVFSPNIPGLGFITVSF